MGDFHSLLPISFPPGVLHFQKLQEERKDGRWMNGWLDGWMDGWMGGWVDGWMSGWSDGRMGGWMDGLLKEISANSPPMSLNFSILCCDFFTTGREFCFVSSLRKSYPIPLFLISPLSPWWFVRHRYYQQTIPH